MKYLSVCSGIEAATVAWHGMGWQPVAFSEIEKFPSAVLAHHYPTVPNWGDMTKFQEWPDANVDVLVGGTPCQSFSVAGLRKGLADPRGNLMLTFGAIAQRYRPRWLVWENVPGVLSSNGGRDFGTFLGMLAELGYGFAYRILDAQYVRTHQHPRAVPQRRRRVFVVGHLGDWHRAAAVLFERHSLSGHPAPSRQAGKDAAKCLTAGAGRRLDAETEDMIPQAIPDIADTVTSKWSKGAEVLQQGARAGGNCIVQQPVAFKVRGGCEGGGKGYLGSTDTAFTISTTHDQDVAVPVAFGAQMSVPQVDIDLMQTLQAKNPMAVAYNITFCDANGRRKDRPNGGLYVSETDVTSTLTKAGIGTNAVQAMQVRRLLPTECEALQGFPRNYTNIPWRGKPESPDGPRYKALGNSMAVPCMAWIGKRIQQVEEI